jgi:hypothetical protein
MEAMLGISHCIAILISTNKNATSFLLLLCLLFNKIGEKGRTGSACKDGGWGGEEGGKGQGEKWSKHYIHM